MGEKFCKYGVEKKKKKTLGKMIYKSLIIFAVSGGTGAICTERKYLLILHVEIQRGVYVCVCVCIYIYIYIYILYFTW